MERKSSEEWKKTSDVYFGVAMMFGMCIGVITDNMELWLPIGTAAGLYLWYTVRRKGKKEEK